MRKTLIPGILILLASLLLPWVAVAQEEATLADVEAKFTGWTEGDAAAAGYEKDVFCIDGSVAGAPELGAMGFHAANLGLMGPLDALNPPLLLIDGEGNVVGAEYFVPEMGQPRPSLFGQEFDGPMPGHSPEMPTHYDLHVWLVENPSGQFAEFNPSLSCPEGTSPPAPELPATGDSFTPGMALWVLVVGMGLALSGSLMVSRRRRMEG